jgi:uncharacterized alpha-E superfamily protein
MLSRTADHLYWMARYTERAENTARMLDVTLTTSLLPQGAGQTERGWLAMLGISELQEGFLSHHEHVNAGAVLDFMIRDPGNPSSIYCCLKAARENARAVRGAVTTEVWETHNSTWLDLLRHLENGLHKTDPKSFLSWVKFRAHLARGVTIGTMLRDEAYHFARLGTFLERADNTARILDVKFHEMSAPLTIAQRVSGQDDQGHDHASLDYYYWAAVLKSVSAFEIYRRVYRDVITPVRVAELLILRRDMPRSLAASLDEVCVNLGYVQNNRSRETQRLAGLLRAELQFGRIDDLLTEGVHAFLTRFLDRINHIGQGISQDFLLPLVNDLQESV